MYNVYEIQILRISNCPPPCKMAVETATAPAVAPAGKVAAAPAAAIPTTAIVHPLVLLSATDHYMRVAKDTKKRVVGVLLGSKEVAGERDTWKTTTHENAVPPVFRRAVPSGFSNC